MKKEEKTLEQYLEYFTSKRIQTFGALLCLGLFSGAIYLQIYKGLVPCPLCVVQRVLIILIGLLFLSGALYYAKKRTRQILHSSIFLLSLFGMFAAGRQLWLEKHASEITTGCLPGWDYLIQTLPIKSLITLIFSGTADCSLATPLVFGFSIPFWTFIFFVIFAAMSLNLALKD